MPLKLGVTTKVEVGTGGSANWENTYPASIQVRIVGDVAFNVKVGPNESTAATVDDCYVATEVEMYLSLAKGESLSFATADGNGGNVWVTEVRESA